MVISGHTAIDASTFTRESVPVEVSAGDQIFGGCVNTRGRIVVDATRVGADTQLARLVKVAQNGEDQV